MFKFISTVFIISIFAKVLGFIRDVVLVNTLGLSGSTDAYYAANGIIDFFIVFSGLGSMMSVTASTYSKILSSDSKNSIQWHPHIHAIVAEGVFTQDGQFESVANIRLEKAIEIWRDKVFDILFNAGLLDLATIESMLAWKHTGFNIYTSVRIEANDRA